MDVVYPENSSDTYWEGSGIRILSRIHITMGVLELYRRQHVGAQQQLPALPDPQPTQKIKIGTRDQLENRPESPPNPVFNPVVAKIAKIDFGGDLRPKTVPEWSLRASGWNPRVPQKSTW